VRRTSTPKSISHQASSCAPRRRPPIRRGSPPEALRERRRRSCSGGAAVAARGRRSRPRARREDRRSSHCDARSRRARARSAQLEQARSRAATAAGWLFCASRQGSCSRRLLSDPQTNLWSSANDRPEGRDRGVGDRPCRDQAWDRRVEAALGRRPVRPRFDVGSRFLRVQCKIGRSPRLCSRDCLLFESKKPGRVRKEGVLSSGDRRHRCVQR
jgi:hypothetical protein